MLTTPDAEYERTYFESKFSNWEVKTQNIPVIHQPGIAITTTITANPSNASWKLPHRLFFEE